MSERRVGTRVTHAPWRRRRLWTVLLATLPSSLAATARPGDAQLPPSLPAESPVVDSASIAGIVRSRFGNETRPLPSAAVQVAGSGLTRTLTADSTGRYELTGIPPGPLRLRASHPGHQDVSLVVMLAAGSALRVDLELVAAPLAVPGVDVEATEASDHGDPDADVPRIDDGDILLVREAMQAGPGASETSVARAVSALPGRDPADPTDVLFMRGSGTELKLVLLDGVPVVAPFQVAGLVDGLDRRVLASARFHRGGAPARYDGGLTHILDLRTRTARRDRLRVFGSVDLLASAVTAEVPLGERAGVLASGRYLNGLGQPSVDGHRPYGYADGLVSFDARPADGQEVRATAFWNDESVRLDYGDRAAPAEWGNAAASASWSGRVGSAAVSASAGASRYRARLPLRPTPTEADPTPADVLASASTRRARAVVEAAWGTSDRMLRAGASVERLATDVVAEVVGEPTTSTFRGDGGVAGVFAEARRTVAEGVVVRAGLRADLFEGSPPQLSPRFALSWVASPSAVVTVAAGRYHQMTQSVSTGFLTEGGPLPPAPSVQVPLARADHVVLSLQQRFGKGLGVDLDGYWKRYEGTGGPGEPPVLNSGIDASVRGDVGRARLWLGYGLSWFWTPDGTDLARSGFAGRHLLTAGLSGSIAGPVGAEAVLAYGAGLPSTGIPLGADRSDALAGPGLETLAGGAGSGIANVPPPDVSFLRVDLEVYATFQPEWAGHRWEVRPYVRLLNPLDRRDALFYAYGAADGSLVPLARRPVLPVAGLAFSY